VYTSAVTMVMPSAASTSQRLMSAIRRDPPRSSANITSGHTT
jgi:hypothetical protein